ncbi:hypothetical protein V2J09_005833 [Rumex salicifolius]
MGRKPCCQKEGMNKGAWTAIEDKILTDYISINGEGKWRNLPIHAGLKRCGKSCRLRWLNYLKPDIKRGNISCEEEDLIIRLHKLLGNRWSLIAGRLPGRTDNEIKNYWNTNIGKRFKEKISTHQGHVHNQNKCKSSMLTLRLHNNHQNPRPPIPTNAIRTKATRCTKVVISGELQSIKENKNNVIEKNSFETTCDNNDPMEAVSVGPQGVLNQGSAWASSEINRNMQVDLDDHILSKILEAREFSPYYDLQHLQQKQEQNECTLKCSPLMNENLFLDEDMDGELDTDWITSFLQTELTEETS